MDTPRTSSSSRWRIARVGTTFTSPLHLRERAGAGGSWESSAGRWADPGKRPGAVLDYEHAGGSMKSDASSTGDSEDNVADASLKLAVDRWSDVDELRAIPGSPMYWDGGPEVFGKLFLGSEYFADCLVCAALGEVRVRGVDVAVCRDEFPAPGDYGETFFGENARARDVLQNAGRSVDDFDGLMDEVRSRAAESSPYEMLPELEGSGEPHSGAHPLVCGRVERGNADGLFEHRARMEAFEAALGRALEEDRELCLEALSSAGNLELERPGLPGRIFVYPSDDDSRIQVIAIRIDAIDPVDAESETVTAARRKQLRAIDAANRSSRGTKIYAGRRQVHAAAERCVRWREVSSQELALALRATIDELGHGVERYPYAHQNSPTFDWLLEGRTPAASFLLEALKRELRGHACEVAFGEFEPEVLRVRFLVRGCATTDGASEYQAAEVTNMLNVCFPRYTHSRRPSGTIDVSAFSYVETAAVSDPLALNRLVSLAKELVEHARLVPARAGIPVGPTADEAVIAFSPSSNGDVAMATSESKTEERMATGESSGRYTGALVGHDEPVVGATVLDGGRILSWASSSSSKNLLRTWDAATGALLATFEGRNVKVLPDARIIVRMSDSTFRVADGVTGATLTTFTHQATRENSQAWCDGATVRSDGRIVSWGYDEIFVWDEAGSCEGRLSETYEIPCEPPTIADIVETSGGRFLSWSLTEAAMFLWEIPSRTGAPRQKWARAVRKVMLAHDDSVCGATALPDGRILSWSSDETVRLWDESGALLATLKGHTAPVLHATLLGDGRILSWSEDASLRLWDGATGAPLATLVGHSGPASAAFVLTDGRILSWSEGDGSIRTWDGATGKPIATLADPSGKVKGVARLAGDRVLFWARGVRASGDGSSHEALSRQLFVWDANAHGGVTTLDGHSRNVNGATVLPDGRILSWSDDKTLRLWDASERSGS
jgi:WD40 repeat protein